MFGPDITPSALSVDAKGKSGSYGFLSNMWYAQKY
jgi:hypothetical protein